MGAGAITTTVREQLPKGRTARGPIKRFFHKSSGEGKVEVSKGSFGTSSKGGKTFRLRGTRKKIALSRPETTWESVGGNTSKEGVKNKKPKSGAIREWKHQD